MKSKWTTTLMVAMFSGALAIGSAASAAGATGGTTSGATGGTTGGTTGHWKSQRNMEKMDMSKLDTNGDGKISQKEAAANPALAEHFKKFDQNGDGQLDKGEFARFETMEHGKSMQPGGESMEHGKSMEKGQQKTW